MTNAFAPIAVAALVRQIQDEYRIALETVKATSADTVDGHRARFIEHHLGQLLDELAEMDDSEGVAQA